MTRSGKQWFKLSWLGAILLLLTAGGTVRAGEKGPEIRLSPTVTNGCCPDYWIISSRRCPQTHEPGCIDRCLDYFHYTSGRLRRSNAGSWQAWLEPDVPICIMIHGSFLEWEEVRKESRATYRWLRKTAPNQPLQVVFYSWPSEGLTTPVPQIDVGILGRRAAFNGLYLSQLIGRISPSQPISLIGHSHGARMTAATLHLLGGGGVQGYRLADGFGNGRRIRTVLAGAAIDHHWLNPGERYGRALCATESLVNLKNRDDVVLKFYPLRRLFSDSALGLDGFMRKDRSRLGWLNRRVLEMDVTQIVETGHLWPNYYEHPEIADGIVPWVYFEEKEVGWAEQGISRTERKLPPQKSRRLLKSTHPGPGLPGQ